MNRHHRARYWRLIDTINRVVGWLPELVFAAALGLLLAALVMAFFDASIRASAP